MRLDNLGNGSFRDDRLPAYGAQLINCYAVPRAQAEGAPGAYYIAGTTGLDLVHTFTGGAVGSMFEFKSVLYGVSGTDLVKVAPTPSVIAAGAITGTGLCEIAWDRSGIVILRDNALHFFNGSTVTSFTLPTGTPQEYASTCAELDNFALYGVDGSSKFYQSGAVDPTTIDASYYATKESRPDDLVRMIVNKRNLMLFGTETIEPYYNQGISGGVTFGAYSNAMIELGLGAKWSLAARHGQGFFLASNRKVYNFADITVREISPPWLDTLIGTLDDATFAAAIGFVYVHEGALCYALTFPGVLTVEWTGEQWHHRESPGLTYWRPQCSYPFGNTYYFGSSTDGRVWKRASPSAYEGSETITRTVITGTFGPKEDRTSLHAVDVHLNPYNATSGTFDLSYSDDEGRTWSTARAIAFPVVGKQRSIARGLGQFRRRMLRVVYDGVAPFRMEDMYISMGADWPRGRYVPEQAGAALQ